MQVGKVSTTASAGGTPRGASRPPVEGVHLRLLPPAHMRTCQRSPSNSASRRFQPIRATSTKDVAIDGEESSPGAALGTCKVAVYSSKPYMTPFFEPAIMGEYEESKFISAKLDEETALLAAGFDVVCLFVNDDCGPEVLKVLAEGGVKLIAMRCAGYDRVDVKAANKLGIRVVRVPAYSPESVAEHAVALAMALTRNIHLAYNRVWQGNYTLSGLEGMEIHGKTVGVIGTGAIGACFCAIMKGFGCRVLASDLRENPRCLELGVEYVDQEYLLEESDIVSLHCPLLTDTFRMINRDRLVKMKPTAILINVSRGGLVDTDALLDALEAGDIGGCGMDVYENEGNLFFEDFTVHTSHKRLQNWDRRFASLKGYPNVLITPHSAFLTKEALQSIAGTTVQNIKEFCAGQELTNEVKIVA